MLRGWLEDDDELDRRDGSYGLMLLVLVAGVAVLADEIE